MSDSTTGQIVGAVVGGTIGFIYGGPLGAVQGAAIGYSVGGAVDPPPGPNIEGPRLGDKRITVSTYGEPMPLVYGPRTRLSGNVIWSTGLIETKKKKKSGGKGGGGSTTTTYSYRMSLSISLSGRALPNSTGVKKIWANGKVIMDVNAESPAVAPTGDAISGLLLDADSGTHAVFSELHFWPGGPDQEPDPLIEAFEGVGNVPAHRHEVTVSIKDLQLADFGNRMPNLEFELEADPSVTVAQVLHDICARCNVENASVFGLTDTVGGYIVSQGNGLGAIAPLATAYFFDQTEQRGQVRFVKRGLGMKGTIPVSDMGGRQANETPITPIEHSTIPEVDLPKQLSVSYSDPDLDFQTNTQQAFREEGNADSIQSVDLALTLDADHARQIADRLLWLPWAARKSSKFRVSDRWVRLEPGDILGVPVAGQVLPYKLLQMTRGDNGVIELDVQQEDYLAYQSAVAGATGLLPENVVRLPGETRLILMDAPIWRDEDDNAGFYWAVTAENKGWRGATVHRSSDGGLSYDVMSDVGVRTTIGDVAAATPAGPTSIWDRTTVITVVLAFEDDELESASELLVLNGANAAWLGNPDGIGGEWLQFATATLMAPLTYELSDLLRGQLGTEHLVGTHGPNEVLIMATEASTGRTDYGPGDWDTERLYKPASTLMLLETAADQDFTNAGAGKTPYSPVHIRGERDGSNNLTITYVRRSRLRAPGIGNGPVPLGEATEAYEIDILDEASPPGVLRTLTATAPEVEYPAALQTEDGITPGDPVSLRVYQMSDVRGRGYPGEATV
jgi:hypothetical protein